MYIFPFDQIWIEGWIVIIKLFEGSSRLKNQN